MKSTVEKLDGLSRKINVEIPAAKVQQATHPGDRGRQTSSRLGGGFRRNRMGSSHRALRQPEGVTFVQERVRTLRGKLAACVRQLARGGTEAGLGRIVAPVPSVLIRSVVGVQPSLRPRRANALGALARRLPFSCG